MKKLKLDYSKYNSQVDASFKTTDNEVLNYLSTLKYNNSFFFYPTIIVNGFIYRGNPEPYEVYELICASLTPMPEGCNDFM